jgi:polysaccharide pyruvyl transferase WcaK-like protein
VKPEPKCVGMFGLFGVGNLGNDGSLEAALHFLRRATPQERLLCICGDPDAVQQNFAVDTIPIYYRPRSSIPGRVPTRVRKAFGKVILWFHAVRHLSRVRVPMVPGTGILDDFGAWPLAWPYDLVSWCVLARLMGVKVIFASIGAGPISHPLSRWFMKSAARAAHYRSYRDTVSKAFMERIGFDTHNDPIYPDIAFALPVPAAACRPESEDRPLTIGVGVMAYHGWRNDRARGAKTYAGYLEKI